MVWTVLFWVMLCVCEKDQWNPSPGTDGLIRSARLYRPLGGVNQIYIEESIDQEEEMNQKMRGRRLPAAPLNSHGSEFTQRRWPGSFSK
jgi:hypothetical protein